MIFERNQTMKRIIKLTSLLLAVLMILSITMISCNDESGSNNHDNTTTENSNNNDGQPSINHNLQVNVTVLSGTTGMGMAKLIADTNNNQSALKYNFTVISDPTQIVSGIVGGSIDVAAVPTNLASTLYKKTNGNVQVLALNTLGVLYVLENGTNINSISDLRGKTVYVPGQGTNPEYILKYVIEKNGMKVGTDVIFDYSYNSPDTLATAVVSGLAGIALLPEPKVTAVKSQNKEVRVAIDLTKEWDKVAPAGSLVQGCVIVRKDFIDANKAEINAFLDEYKASVEFVNNNIDEASELIAAAGIIPKAGLAKQAIPNCNIVYAEGEALKTALSKFYEILFSVAPASIGGEIPSDGLYYNRG